MKLPTMGPKMNCIAAKIVAKTAPQRAADPRPSPFTSWIKSGMTGKINPMPIASMTTVKRMKVMGRRLSDITATYPYKSGLQARMMVSIK